MDQRASANIFLTGFSYTGKSIVAREVAQKLGWRVVDTDDEVTRAAGKSIPDIFAQDGEPHFRELEREALRRACVQGEVVVSTGGGAIMDQDSRGLMYRHGVIVCLEARPETIYRRLLQDAQQRPDSVVRPLLAAPDPLRRITELKRFRQPFYALSDWTVHTDGLSPGEVAEEVVRGWRYGLRRRLPHPAAPSAHEADSPYCRPGDATCVVTTTTQSYPVFVGAGFFQELGHLMKETGLVGRASVISDENVFAHHGQRVEEALGHVGFAPASFVLPPGESTKTLEWVSRAYDWLVERRAERRDPIVALGGGVVGDLSGFVAATFLRGVPLVQVPTSLMAMVDSSIGGKTGVNHPQAKNLIGAFYQPRLVVADVDTLATLPPRELTSGWTEVIKHALIREPLLLTLLEDKAAALTRLSREPLVEAVRLSAAVKAQVVSEDEREEKGVRTILNYGHTLGHALEAAAGYGELLHGEAVAVGMMGAALISQRLGLLDAEVVARQRTLLETFGLPTRYPGVDIVAVLRALELDKKVKGAAINWVLLWGPGQVEVRADVPMELVEEVIKDLVR